MHFPYSSLIVEADSAKRHLARVFQLEAPGDLSSVAQTDIQRTFGKKDPKAALTCLKKPFNFLQLRGIHSNSWKNNRSSKGLYWMREDMGALSFAWTLVLLSAIAAAQTDQPILWLSIGPVPLALGVAAAGILRRRFDFWAILRGFRGSCQCLKRQEPGVRRQESGGRSQEGHYLHGQVRKNLQAYLSLRRQAAPGS
jgi:hypothetical protein